MNRSESTRQGISKARACRVVWGRYGAVLAARNRQDAQEFAETLHPLLLDLESSRCLGSPHLRSRRLARKLNELGIPARNGGKWYPTTVDRLLKRLGASLEEERKHIREAKLQEERRRQAGLMTR